MNRLTLSVLMFFLLFNQLFSSDKNNSQIQQLKKPLIRSANNFDGNRIDCDVENNGMFVSHLISGRSGMEWPKGNNTTTVYASGVFLGGKVNGEIRVTAGEYNGEYASGPWGAYHDDPKHKIYKVNKSDIANPLNNQDFQNWPTELGAPWVDNNENGKYEPMPNGPDHPEFIGNQVLWMVMNDGVDSLHTIFHSSPLGVEVQRTIFGLDRVDAFGDIMFVKDLIINKGGNTIEDMYIGLWCDPDLGDASDDFVGTDTTLGMGICYNDGDDANFINGGWSTPLGMTPAVGYDFFQGPAVPAPGETAYMFGREISDTKNLKMTSFIKYIGADPVYYDPNNAREAYFYMTGFLPDGSDFPYIATGGSKFLHPGDPTKDTGPDDNEFVDGDLHPSDDRRFLMNSGPLTMAPSDSQEIVFGIINAADGDWDDSYLRLKEVDKIAQAYFDAHFQNSEEPTSPIIEATALDDQIILKWNESEESYNSEDIIDRDPETNDPTYYKFEGYNVYQVENVDGSGEIKRIATFDKINDIRKILDDVYVPEYGKYINIYVQHGSDSGLRREMQITKDALNYDSPLLTNREYYFAVTAYGYNEFGIPKTLESIKEIIAVRPQVPSTWRAHSDTITYNYTFDAEHTKGVGDGLVFLTIIDKTQITGNSYRVTFNDYLLDGLDTLEITNWNLTNITTGETILENQTTINDFNSTDGREYNESPIADGLRINVLGPKPDIKWIVVTANANGPIQSGIVDALPSWRYPDWLSWNNGNYDNQQTNGATWLLNTHPGYGPGGPETFYNSVTFASGGLTYPLVEGSNGIQNLVPYDFECRFTGNGKAFDYFDGSGIHDVPFEWWNIGNGTPDWSQDDYKLISYYLDDSGDGEWGLVPDDHETSGGDNDPYTDRMYIMAPTNNTPGTQGHNDFFDNVLADGSNVAEWTSGPGDNDPGGPMDTWNVFSRLIFMNWNGGDAYDPTFPANINALEPELGTVFRITTTKPNTSGDEYEFSTATFAGSTIEYQPKNINVWPNPYFAYNPEETISSDRQIHFTNLTAEGICVIRIFDLAGKLVRKIDHTNGTQFEIWDVRDYHSNPVASGMYIVHIHTEEGEKILKLAIIQPN